MKKMTCSLALLLILITAWAQPSGTIIAFAGPKTKIPAGWILCDGTLYDRTNTNYRALFDAIGVSWGGDGGDKFAVPDLRGQFLRGVTEEINVDPEAGSRDKSRPDLNSSGNGGNAVGSKQKDQLRNHSHALANIGFRNDNLANGRARWDGAEFSTYNAGQSLKDINSLLRLDGAGGAETRPTNAYVYYIIKL